MSRLPGVPGPFLSTSTLAVPPVEVPTNTIRPPDAPLAVPPLAISVALPAVEVPKNSVAPPNAPLTVPPLAMSVALPASEVSSNCVTPPPAPLTVAPLLLMVALPAVEVPKNSVKPPPAPLTVPPLLVKVPLAAVEVSKKFVPPPNAPLTAVPPLFVNNTTGSGTGSGSVTVNKGTLGGSGTIGFNVQNIGAVTVNTGAILAPGPTGNGSTGILDTGRLTLASGSYFSVDLNGDVPGMSYDQVVMGDASAMNGGVFINGSILLINTALNLAVGEHLFIVENNGPNAVSGTFAFLPEGTVFSADGVNFQISYNASGQGGGNDIELSVVSSAVPEPTTWVGGALGFVALAYWQRRRRAQILRRA